MDDNKKPPLVFANNVIRQTADHAIQGNVVLLPQDFTTLRVTFRKMGGSWTLIADGDVTNLRLLSRIVSRWGKMSGRKRKTGK